MIGSNIFNIGSVLGITAIIKDIPIAEEIIQRDIIWMMVFTVLIMLLSVLPEKNKISKYKGLDYACWVLRFYISSICTKKKELFS